MSQNVIFGLGSHSESRSPITKEASDTDPMSNYMTTRLTIWSSKGRNTLVHQAQTSAEFENDSQCNIFHEDGDPHDPIYEDQDFLEVEEPVGVSPMEDEVNTKEVTSRQQPKKQRKKQRKKSAKRQESKTKTLEIPLAKQAFITHKVAPRKNLLKYQMRQLVQTCIKARTKTSLNNIVSQICQQEGVDLPKFFNFIDELQKLRNFGIESAKRLWSGSKMTIVPNHFHSSNRILRFRDDFPQFGRVFLRFSQVYLKRLAVSTMATSKVSMKKEGIASHQHLLRILKDTTTWTALALNVTQDDSRCS